MFRGKTARSLLLGVSALFIIFQYVVGAHAQNQPFSLTTSPLPINLTTTPGKPVSTELRVKNSSSVTQKLKVSLYKFSVNEQNEVQISEATPTDDYMSWVSFSPQTFDAAPNEWRTVKMTIAVPADAALGYYYAVGFSRADAPKATPGAATLQGQVITFVLLDVDVPGAKRELKVTSFTSSRSVYEFLPARFSITVRNTGNIHLVPSGNIFIKRGDNTLDTLAINPGLSNVLPGSSRTFTAEWTDGFPLYQPKLKDGNPVINQDTNAAELELKWDLSDASKLKIGPYSAQLLLVYDDGTRDVPIEGEVGFWVMPWRILGVVVLVVTLVGVGVWTIARKIFGRISRKDNKAS